MLSHSCCVHSSSIRRCSSAYANLLFSSLIVIQRQSEIMLMKDQNISSFIQSMTPCSDYLPLLAAGGKQCE